MPSATVLLARSFLSYSEQNNEELSVGSQQAVVLLRRGQLESCTLPVIESALTYSNCNKAFKVNDIIKEWFHRFQTCARGVSLAKVGIPTSVSWFLVHHSIRYLALGDNVIADAYMKLY